MSSLEKNNNYFLYDKLDVLIDLEYARAKTFVRTLVDVNDIQRCKTTPDVYELKSFESTCKCQVELYFFIEQVKI